jgi:type II secretion system protein N
VDRRKQLTFITLVVLWGAFVMCLTVYLFFPYQKALKLALQNVVGGGRTAVSMEGVVMKPLGVKAQKIVLRPDMGVGAPVQLELSRVNITWNPFSLIRGKLTIYSQASLYDGRLKCVIDGVPLAGSSSPDISLKLDGVNIAKYPEGAMAWFKGISGILDGTMQKQVPVAQPERQRGSFRLNLRNGEIRDLQIKNMPRLVIPYRQIVLEGKMDGSRVDLSKIAVTSDIIALNGSGSIDTGDLDHMDIRLAYTALSQGLPLSGKGTIVISGSRTSPNITLAAAQEQNVPAQQGQAGQQPAAPQKVPAGPGVR